MQYALLFYTTETFDSLPPAERQEWLAQMIAWRKSLAEAGVLRGALRLAPSATATSVRRDGDEVLFTDGPFAETKEILAGFILLDCADLDAALAWAGRCPISRIGTVEVRPEHPEGPMREPGVS
ncbi:MAG TPA: YciI family protein [Myxococcota bacterium]|nr:YciI family protein [Myxococcota bacterium]